MKKLGKSTSVTAGVYYHGTMKEFAKPRVNGLGILWLAENPVVAVEYAMPYYAKGGWLWTFRVEGRFPHLNDLGNPAIRAYYDNVNEVAKYGFKTHWSEDEWSGIDFSILETYRFGAKMLKSLGVDGVVVDRDNLNSGISHDSLALFNLRAIKSSSKRPVDRSESPVGETGYETKARIRAWKRS